MRRIAGVLILSSALLAGCQTPDPGLPPILDIAQMNCAPQPDLGRAVVLSMTEDKQKSVNALVDAASPCLVSGPGEKSLYAVFRLPSSATGYVISVNSLFSVQSMMAPALLFLNEQGREMRRINGDSFLFRGSSLNVILRSRADETYMVVMSDPKAVGKEISQISSELNQSTGYTAYGSYTIYTGVDGKRNFTYSYGGKVMVSLSELPKGS